MELNANAVKALLDAFDRSDWQEMTISVGSDTLHVSRQAGSGGPGAAPAAAAPAAAGTAPPAGAAAPAAPASDGAAPATEQAPPSAEHVPASPAMEPAPGAQPAMTLPAGASEPPSGGTLVESPSVGLFWRAPSPGAPPFVEEGATVAAGDTIAIVEVMKLMNHVVAPVAGTVTAVLVENGATVEFGQPLISIDPED